MSTFTWTTGLSGDWGLSTNWNPNTVPDDTAAIAVLPGTASGYTVTISNGESEVVNSITLGDLINLNGPTLDVVGTLTFGGSNPSMAFQSGSMVVASGGVLAGSGQLGNVQTIGRTFTLTNNGTVRANAGAGSVLAVLTQFTNSGTVLADNGEVGIEGGAGLTNLSGTTLTGGNWVVQGPSSGTFNQILFGFNFDADIVVDAANIVLDGAATELQGYTGTPGSGSFQPIEQQLQTIASTGTLQLLDGRGYSTTNTLQDNGKLVLQGGTLGTGALTVGSTGTLSGFGVISGSVANQGVIAASGGALDIGSTVTNSGSFSVAPGATLILNGATATTLSNSGVVYDASGLLNISSLSGAGTLIVQSGATIEIGGASSQTAGFSGSNAVLLLNNFSSYTGTISGFAQSDTIELAGTSATSAFLSGSTLVVMNNSTTVDTIQLAGSYSAGASFSVANMGTNAAITNLSGAPLRQDFAFTVSLSDTAGLTGTQETQIVNDLSAAAADWAQYLTGHAPLRIQLNVTPGSAGSELASGGPAEDVPSGTTLDGRQLDTPSSILALTTGNYAPGTTADIIVNLPLAAGELGGSGGLYVNPSPFSGGGTVPANEFDLVTVFRHELAHGLGFIGLTQSDGSLGSQELLYDHFIQKTTVSGTITAANFVGPNAETAYGAFLGTNTATPVPLTLLNNGENYSHVANSSGDPLGLDLMSGVGLTAGTQRDISSVDLAMLQDVGAPITAICFAAGTQIATPRGEVPVEQLAIGDLVLTLSGNSVPIVWIGVGRVLVTRGRRSAATPVIVRKGALADHIPYRDLRVTKGHSLYLEGALIPVEYLVNHRSILWDDRAQEVSIYHIELATHDVLLANGAPAESYRDDGNRWLFQNRNQAWGLEPQPPCAPILTSGEAVDRIWRQLLERDGERPGVPLTSDPDMHLLVDGERLDAVEHRDDTYVFRLPSRPRSVRLRSRASIPQELGLTRDPRQLGVAVRSIALSQSRVIHSDDSRLTCGFHDFEPHDGIRWTDGDAALPIDLFEGVNAPITLSLHLGGSTHYLDEGSTLEAACAA